MGKLGSHLHARQFSALEEMLSEAGVEILESHFVERGRELTRQLRRCIRRGKISCIAVAGGDGSMTRAAAELAHQPITLGVLPTGTGNSFARGLGIESLETAVKTIAHGPRSRIDLGIVNGSYFANFATIGLVSEIAAATPEPLKAVSGIAAYVFAGIVAGLRSRAFTIEIRGPGVSFDGKVHQVVVVCGRCFGVQPIAADASVTSGKLVVFTTTANTAADIAKDFLAIGMGTQTDLENGHSWAVRRARIRTGSAQHVAIDGQVIGKTPVTRFKIDPRALRVFVPPDRDGAS
ncbi:MAG: diacylglycerol/lipid kinase family protein [Vulcanimicrobiaceae bacterium]